MDASCRVREAEMMKSAALYGAEVFRAHRIHGYMPDFKVLP